MSLSNEQINQHMQMIRDVVSQSTRGEQSVIAQAGLVLLENALQNLNDIAAYARSHRPLVER